jgi:hypothetical protein
VVGPSRRVDHPRPAVRRARHRGTDIVPVELSHPRDLGSLEYGRIKNRLYELLGVSHSI